MSSLVLTPKQTEMKTRHNVERRIEYVVHLLRKYSYRRALILRKIKTRYGVGDRQTQNYIAEAQKHLLLHIKDEKDNQKSSSICVYQGVIQDPNATNADKIRAQERIDKILGLEEPTMNINATINATMHVHKVDSLGLDVSTKRLLLDAMREKRATPVIDVA